MTIIRMLSPEALIRLVAGEDAHQNGAEDCREQNVKVLYVLPAGQGRGRSAKAGRRDV